MKKVLIVITTDFVSYGGLTTVMMNYYRAMDKNELRIDFASTNSPSPELLGELAENGSRYFDLGSRKKRPLSYRKALKDLLRREGYDVIHVNGNSATMALELDLARRLGVPRRIAHTHTTRSSYPLVNRLLQPRLKRACTTAIAVSHKAGDWLFGGNYLVLNNAIDPDRYGYDPDLRDRFREDHGLTGRFVLGNVGKLNPAKNHAFLLEVFAAYRAMDPTAALVIAGGGQQESALRSRAQELGLGSDVTFLGMSRDVRTVLQGFDLFVFPSIFEGLGLALIEAQASGLPCLASDPVPRETAVTDQVSYLSLAESPEVWARKILELKEKMPMDARAARCRQAAVSIRDRGYDISVEAEKLQEIYLNGRPEGGAQ